MKLKQLAVALALPFVMNFFAGNAMAETRHNGIRQLTPYLYMMTYTDYDYNDYLAVRGQNRAKEPFGCSAVHNGQFVGRNFDYLFNETPEYLVHVPRAENRLASIGIGYLFTEKPFQRLDNRAFVALPWSMLDGINEKGVSVCVNFCPAKDLVFHIAEGGTQLNKEDLDLSTVVRYVLDNATSARNALELLEKKNIVNDLGENSMLKDTGFGMHFMIADRKSHYIVEFIGNHMYYTKDDAVMTNFYNTMLPKYTPHAMGVERYDVLKSHYKWGKASMDGMTRLMKLALFTEAYNNCAFPLRFSDVGTGYDDELEVDVTNEMIAADPKLQAHIVSYMESVRVERNQPNVWHTVSTSVYDLDNLIMRLYTQDDYNNYFEFTLAR